MQFITNVLPVSNQNSPATVEFRKSLFAFWRWPIFSKLRLAQPALSVVIGLAEPMTDSRNHLKIGHPMGVKR